MWQGIASPMGARNGIEKGSGDDKERLEDKHQHGMRRAECHGRDGKAGGKDREKAEREPTNA